MINQNNIPLIISTSETLLATLEGFKPFPYMDSAGIWTIAFGTVIRDSSGQRLVGPGEANTAHQLYPILVTQETGKQLMTSEVNLIIKEISSLVQVSLTVHQAAALVSFVYNIGEGAFKGSTLLKDLNQGLFDLIPNQIERWDISAGKISAGLENRRKQEVACWRTPDA